MSLKRALICQFILLLEVLVQEGHSSEHENIRFNVIFSKTLRNTEQPPTIKVTFANGFQDELELQYYKINEADLTACNYIGHLKNDISSAAAVTGCLNDPEDVMDVTLISSNNINKMFSVDFHGNAKVIKNPFCAGEKSIALRANDGFDEIQKHNASSWHLHGDELLNDVIEHDAKIAKLTNIPSVLKATIKFGYEDGMKAALGSQTFNSWIQSVLAHTQVHFRHPSLGTRIEFEVNGNSIHKTGATWTADNNIRDARSASNANAGPSRPATFSWWCNRGGGGIAGIAYVGSLCGYSNTNLNEKQSSTAASAFILAHELGHNFGMWHDFDPRHGGENGPCNRKGIMSYGSYGYNQWSTCSRSDWEHHYASRNWGISCLKDISGLKIFGCHSSQIALKSAHGKYVVAEANGHANANRVKLGPWEIFSVEELKDGTIALKSHHGKYLVAENNYEVNANRNALGPWEIFKVLKQADGSYAFMTWKGRYLVAESDGRLRADRTWIKPWEKFKVDCV